MTDYAEAQALLETRLAEMGVTLGATFIPQSKSRNAGEKNPTLNWLVVVMRAGKRPFSTDYSQGIGHAPGYPQMARRTNDLAGNERHAAERGRYPTNWYSLVATHDKTLPPPKLSDVLACLLLDGSAYGQTFEEWAGDMGYDTDSRDAERTYHACIEAGRATGHLFTGAELDELRPMIEAAGL